MDPRLTHIYQQLPTPIFICSGELYEIEYLNPAAEKAWKRNAGNILQRRLNLAFPELNQSSILEKVERLLENNQPFSIPQIQITNDLLTGGDTYLSLNFQRLQLAGNPRIYFTVTATDITELVQVRAEAEQLRKAVGLNNAMLNAHHEATPFAVLIVDAKGGIISITKKFVELWNLPEQLVQAGNDDAALEYAMTQVSDPEAFIGKVRHLYLHPEEMNYDEILFKDGRIIERYGKTVMGEDGTYYGWAWHFRDISHLKIAAAELKQKNKELEVLLTEFQFVTDTIPQLAWATEPDGATSFFNKGWQEYTGLAVEALLGDGWLQSIHPDDASRTLNAWQNSVTTGNAYEIEYRIRRHDGEYRWFLARGTPLKDKANNIVKWYGTSTDIYDQKVSGLELEKRVRERTAALEEQRQFTRSILDASMQGIYALRARKLDDGSIIDFSYLFVNDVVAAYFGVATDEVIGRNMLELIPENKTNGFYDIFCKVLEKQEAARGESHFITSTLDHWFIYAVVPIDSATIVVTIQDISEQKHTLQEVEQQRNLLDSIMTNSPSGITVSEMIRDAAGKVIDSQVVLANKISEKISGLAIDEMLSRRMSEVDPNFLDSALFAQSVETLETGAPFIKQPYLNSSGRWLEISLARMDENRLISIFTDVTFIRKTQLEHASASDRLSAIFNNAHAAMFTFSPVTDTRGEIVDFRFVITNPTFAAYVGQTSDTLNGALGSEWFPGYLTNGVFDMYRETYLSGVPQRKDVHYNVDQHDLFLDIMSTRVADEVLVTFTDYTPLKMAKGQLEKYVEELKHSNNNLQDFAYAASHDLKEPIRKIKIFSERLKIDLLSQLTPVQKNYFERMEGAAMRMNALIEDLLFYNEVSVHQKEQQEINFNHLVDQVLHDLDLEIEEKLATISVAPLFTFRGHSRHLQQVFQNLIGNALKYSQPGKKPEITITYDKVKGVRLDLPLSEGELQNNYYVIEVRDNGIGFDPADAGKIFNLFQRLHNNSSYLGTGLGLSIVRKIIENHSGYVIANGIPGEGAVFKVVLPVVP